MDPEFDAVLVIDMQASYVAAIRPKYALLLENQKKILDFCIKEKKPIFFITDTHGGELIEEYKQILKDYDNSFLIPSKPTNGAFFETNLKTELDNRNIETISIIGLFASICCISTARQAKSKKFGIYEVIIYKNCIEDASNNDKYNKSIGEYKQIGCQVINS